MPNKEDKGGTISQCRDLLQLAITNPNIAKEVLLLNRPSEISACVARLMCIVPHCVSTESTGREVIRSEEVGHLHTTVSH